jgi:hypothetical protein
VLAFFFLLGIVQLNIPRWQHQIESCSMKKTSMQPKPKFKSSMLQYIHEYIGTGCTWAWAVQQVGRDWASLGLGLQSVTCDSYYSEASKYIQ